VSRPTKRKRKEKRKRVEDRERGMINKMKATIRLGGKSICGCHPVFNGDGRNMLWKNIYWGQGGLLAEFSSTFMRDPLVPECHDCKGHFWRLKDTYQARYV